MVEAPATRQWCARATLNSPHFISRSSAAAHNGPAVLQTCRDMRVLRPEVRRGRLGAQLHERREARVNCTSLSTRQPFQSSRAAELARMKHPKSGSCHLPFAQAADQHREVLEAAAQGDTGKLRLLLGSSPAHSLLDCRGEVSSGIDAAVLPLVLGCVAIVEAKMADSAAVGPFVPLISSGVLRSGPRPVTRGSGPVRRWSGTPGAPFPTSSAAARTLTRGMM